MGKYKVTTSLSSKRVYENQTGSFRSDLDFDEVQAPGAAQYFLSSLGSCKLVSFLELRTRFHMDIEEAYLEVSGETGRAGTVENTRFPIFRFQRIEYEFHIRSPHTDDELMEYLKYVNAACTMGNSISEKIEQIYRIIRI